jgi:hypothetical protein
MTSVTMDILPSALDRRTAEPEVPDQTGLADLIARVTRRLDSLGIAAPDFQRDAAVLDIVQHIAEFALSWAEGGDDREQNDDAGPDSWLDFMDTPPPMSDHDQPYEAARGERRW